MSDIIGIIENIEREGSEFKKDLNCFQIEEQIEILKYSCEGFYPEEEIRAKFINSKKSNKAINIKYGVDPLSMEMKIEDIPPLILASKLQRMGHKITLLIGDVTALIGDPIVTWNSKELSRKNIERNLKQLRKQLDNFIDFSKVSTVYNSSWVNDIKLPFLIELMTKVHVTNVLKGDKFQNKLDKGEDFTYAKLIYPFLMGLDSIELYPDIEIGTHNQINNFLMCRYMMEVCGIKPELIMTTIPISPDESFFISLDPVDIFKKISKLKKESVLNWYKLFTELTPYKLKEIKKMIEEEKLDLQIVREVLAKIIVARIYDKKESDMAYVGYIKELVRESSTQDITMISGNVEICEFIAASTDLSFAETYDYINTGGVRILSCDGNCLTHITDCKKDIQSISFDKFYIILSDKLILSIKK